MKKYEGVVTHTYLGVDNLDQHVRHERSVDITYEVNRMIEDLEAATEKVSALQKELAELKSRRYWEERTLVTDPKTGMHAVVLTVYQLEAKTLRLDFTQEYLNARTF